MAPSIQPPDADPMMYSPNTGRSMAEAQVRAWERANGVEAGSDAKRPWGWVVFIGLCVLGVIAMAVFVEEDDPAGALGSSVAPAAAALTS